jgi:hypothetical protein
VYQVVLNHDWNWAIPEQKIWYFSPVTSLQDAELQAQSMLARGSASVREIGLACVYKALPLHAPN